MLNIYDVSNYMCVNIIYIVRLSNTVGTLTCLPPPLPPVLALSLVFIRGIVSQLECNLTDT